MTTETIVDVADILCAVERYRRRMAGLLDRLDDTRRIAAEAGVALVAGDGGDLTPLLSHFSDDLRASDHRLSAVLAELVHRS
ncbi:MAG TPA: hypothetical protein VGQ80_05520 [Acidimicrobiia bacterium]|nr:hypothetical protein [Acidimicrobiia bacterium]